MSKKSLCVMPVLGLLLLTLVAPARSSDSEDLLAVVRAGNQSALQSIRTLYCKITLSFTPRSEIITFLGPAEYWRSGNSLRILVPDPKQHHDWVIRDLESKSVLKFRDPQGQETVHFGVGSARPTDVHGPFDGWVLAQFSLAGPEGKRLPFDEVLKKPHKLQSVKREMKDGRQLIVVKFSNEPAPKWFTEYEIWFDPQVNYLARKLMGRSWPTDSPKPVIQRGEIEVLRFKEAAPAVYFPEQVESRSYKDDQLNSTKVVKFTEIRVNQPLPPGALDFPPTPGGALLVDHFKNRSYRTDANGNPTGPGQPLATSAPLPPGTARPTETVEEAKSMTRWILPGSLGVLVLAGGLWLYRKWRPAAEVS